MELTRRTVLVSFVVIGLAAAAAGAGTMALFSDTETSNGNTVQAGTLNLQVGQNDESTWDFSIDDLAPGETTSNVSVEVSNTGSIDADDLYVNTTVTDGDGVSNEAEPAGVNNVSDVIQVTVYENGQDITSDIEAQVSANPDGELYLSELDGSSYSAGSIEAEDTENLVFKFTMDNDAGNEYQGDISTIDLTFKLVQ